MAAGPHGQQADDASLQGVWLYPAARGTGLARLLLDKAMAWARGTGYRRILLDVGDHNGRAIAFYTDAGFVPTGMTSTFPSPRDHLTEREMALTL